MLHLDMLTVGTGKDGDFLLLLSLSIPSTPKGKHLSTHSLTHSPLGFSGKRSFTLSSVMVWGKITIHHPSQHIPGQLSEVTLGPGPEIAWAITQDDHSRAFLLNPATVSPCPYCKLKMEKLGFKDSHISSSRESLHGCVLTKEKGRG